VTKQEYQNAYRLARLLKVQSINVFPRDDQRIALRMLESLGVSKQVASVVYWQLVSRKWNGYSWENTSALIKRVSRQRELCDQKLERAA
jgi:hypothetical protein